jgi:hypothetical protein
MARPGITVTTRDAPAASGPPIVTGTAFIVGSTDRGLTDRAQRIESIADFIRIYGDRIASSYMYDAVDAFFREGGGSAYISRVVGPAAASATVDLEDSTDPTITVTAAGEGDWASGLTATVAVATGITTLTIKDADGNTLDTYSTADGKEGLLAYDGFKYVVLTDAHAGGGDPIAVSNSAFTGGSDDLGSISADDYSDALAMFPTGLGPGQVLAPGQTDPDIHEALLAHAEAHNRVALLDAPNTDVLSSIEAAATAARDTGLGSYGAMFAPWVKVPASASGASRTVPYSAVQAGLEARRDRIASPNVPAAGRKYPLAYAQSLVYEFSDDDRTELIGYGVNTAHSVAGVRETYGYRSLSDPDTDSNWVQFNYSRLRMAIAARAQDIGESFLFSQIDGRGLKLSEFGAAISGMLLDFYVLGSLYGNSPSEAFNVDVGPAVNTPETIAAGELHAIAAVRMSPHGEMIIIEIVKTPITQGFGG